VYVYDSRGGGELFKVTTVTSGYALRNEWHFTVGGRTEFV
jgi:hypothetical protein